MAALYALVGAELLPASFDFNCAETVVFGIPYASSLATTLALSWVSLKISVHATHVSTSSKRPGRSIVFGLDWLELALEQPDPLPAFEAAGLLRPIWTLRSILSCSNVDSFSLAVMASRDIFYLMAGHGILQSFPCATEERCRAALVEHFLFGICDALRGSFCRIFAETASVALTSSARLHSWLLRRCVPDYDLTHVKRVLSFFPGPPPRSYSQQLTSHLVVRLRDLSYCSFLDTTDYLTYWLGDVLWTMLLDALLNVMRLLKRKHALSAECAGLNMTALYQADPKNFASEPPWPGNTGLRVINKAGRDVASFCMVGRVTHCMLKTKGGRSRELCLQPLERFAPRMATVLGRVLSYNSPTFVTKAYGLSFSTKINTGSPSKLPKRVPLNGVIHGPVLCSPDIDVPSDAQQKSV